MPCLFCNRRISSGFITGCTIRYCYCGCCNHCHIGGICPGGMFWYSKRHKHKRDNRHRFKLGQSHGGHGWIPDCFKCNNGYNIKYLKYKKKYLNLKSKQEEGWIN